jgi:hypothetical protein
MECRGEYHSTKLGLKKILNITPEKEVMIFFKEIKVMKQIVECDGLENCSTSNAVRGRRIPNVLVINFLYISRC